MTAAGANTAANFKIADGSVRMSRTWADPRFRLPAATLKLVAHTPEHPRPRIGRPPKTRPTAIPAVTDALNRADQLRVQAAGLRAEADALVAGAIRDALKDHSLADIAAVTGKTKARIHQLATTRNQHAPPTQER